jgi:hypothetical protein
MKSKITSTSDCPISDEVEEHPAFGVIGWNRQQNSGRDNASLFMSEMNNQNVISISIKGAKVYRKRGKERVYSQNEIVRVNLTAGQFSQFITTPNTGDGVPCTLQRVEGREQIPDIDRTDRYGKFKKDIAEQQGEFKDNMDNLLSRAQQMAEGKSIKKTEMRELVREISMARQHLFANLPFLKVQMKEHMDGVVEQGKVEIEAFLENRLREHGLESLKSEMPVTMIHSGEDVIENTTGE